MARRERAVDPQLSAFRYPHPGRRPTEASPLPGDIIMGKYLVGWLLGVPVFVLVILYFFFY